MPLFVRHGLRKQPPVVEAAGNSLLYLLPVQLQEQKRLGSCMNDD